MSDFPQELHTMRLLAQRALLDAGRIQPQPPARPTRREKERLYKQITRRVER